jgi:iron-sulfur cluster assembly protein
MVARGTVENSTSLTETLQQCLTRCMLLNLSHLFTMIQIRPNAEKELQRLLNKKNSHPLLVRLDIVSGGCLEWTYQLTLANTFNPKVETAYQFANFTLVIPNAVIPYLQDLTLDYAEDLMGGGFRFMNPETHQTCGCGNSFALSTTSAPNNPSEDCAQRH